MRKLEIGSGNRPLEGYEHLDINTNCPHLEYCCDMSKVPVPNDTFDEIISVHTIEHQPWKKAKETLAEWVRILKPGGNLRIVTPNFRWIAQSYLDARAGDRVEVEKDYGVMHPTEQAHLRISDNISPGLWANFKIMSSGGTFDQHFAMFDATLLSDLLKEAGAKEIVTKHDGDSLIIEASK